MTVRFQKMEVVPYGMAPSSEQEALQMVELCGRTAYKSEDKITEHSARSFVLMLKGHGHLSVLEHSNIVLRIDGGRPAGSIPSSQIQELHRSLLGLLSDRSSYHRMTAPSSSTDGGFAIGGNVRAWLETLQSMKARSPAHHQFFTHHLHRFYPALFEDAAEASAPLGLRVALMPAEEQLALLRAAPESDLPVFIFKFICDRGITHEVVRHRVFSFTQESTRYVNYKSKGMSLILPEELQPFYHSESGELDRNAPLVRQWVARASLLFDWYQEDLDRGLKPQIARDILPNLLKSELFVTGRWSGWKHFVRLRDSQHAHPRIRLIAQEVRSYFDALGLHAEPQDTSHPTPPTTSV